MFQYNPYFAQPFQAPQVQLTRVNGIESARAYQTPPNSTVALFDSNDDTFYIKSTDASNFPTIRRFRFVEITEDSPIKEYVTKDEFEKFKKEIKNGKQFIPKQDTRANQNSQQPQSES